MTEQQRAAMQAALKALENIHGERLKTGWPINVQEQMDALRAALAQQEPEPMKLKVEIHGHGGAGNVGPHTKDPHAQSWPTEVQPDGTVTPVDPADLAQQEQAEPVAYRIRWRAVLKTLPSYKEDGDFGPWHARAQMPPPSPLCGIDRVGYEYEAQPLYTGPTRSKADAAEIFRLQASHSALYNRTMGDEALMRQALEQMESNKYALAVASPTDDIKTYEAAIAALRERLGEKE